MKTVALAGIFLVLVAFGLAYNWAHPSASSGAGAAAAPGQSGASGQADAAGATGISWVTMRDTREKAFSIQVPQGWKTYGGLFRFSTIDARMIVDMTSPDGLTNLRVGDSTVLRTGCRARSCRRDRVWLLMPPAMCSRRSMVTRDSPPCARDCS